MKSTYIKSVAWLTILSGVMAFVSYFLVVFAVNFNFEFFNKPSLVFSLKDVNPGMLRWSMITDILGYYLLLMPALFFLHEWMLGKTYYRHILTSCGFIYVILGAAGAAILAVLWPHFLIEYTISEAENKNLIIQLFEIFTHMVYGGLWNLINALVVCIWLIGLGIIIKSYHTLFGMFTIVLGLLSLFDLLGGILQIKILSEIGLNTYLLMAPLWAILLGILILQNNLFKINS